MNVAHYLDQLGKELATRGATSAQVASIEFNHDTDQIRVHVSESARVASYPDPFCATIWRDNLFATQFHPEKSQSAGLQLLKNFAELQ